MISYMRKPIISYNIIDACKVARDICIAYAVWFCIFTSITNYFSIGLDATDKDAWHRSGVSVVTDYQTGQQYLKTPEGFLTPRLGVK